MHRFKAAILLYLSSMECKILMKLKKTIVLLSYQVNEAFCCNEGLVRDEKLREVSVSQLFRAENYTDVIENFQ